MNAGDHDAGTRQGRVAVMLGGSSAEREISLASGNAVLSALQAAGVDAHPLDPAVENACTALAGGGYERVFIALHGRGGEDGTLQGMLESIGLPYTGSGVLGSALAMDKLRTKQVWAGAGIPTPPFVVVRTRDELDAVNAALQYPVIVKPAREGSSIGISKVDRAAALAAAWQAAAAHDDCVLVEQWIDGGEYTAGILGTDTLPLIRLETPHEFYDFDAKYRSDSTQYLIPCGLQAAQETALQTLALDAFHAVGASGWGRVDFMLDADGAPWFIEVNTVPGLTDHSLVPMAAAAGGIDFPQLAQRILASAALQGEQHG